MAPWFAAVVVEVFPREVFAVAVGVESVVDGVRDGVLRVEADDELVLLVFGHW